MGEDPPPHLKKIALCSHQGLMVWVGVVFSLSLLSIFVYVTERLGKYVDFIIIRGGGGLICYLPCRNLLPVLDIA